MCVRCKETAYGGLTSNVCEMQRVRNTVFVWTSFLLKKSLQAIQEPLYYVDSALIVLFSKTKRTACDCVVF